MLTMRSLVEVDALGLRVLVAGDPRLLDAPLLWVHNTELLDPSGYLRERELVLTNGLWHEEGNAAAFVANVVRAGGAGIVYGLRDVTPESPRELVEACEGAGLPLLELPIEVPFTHVTQAAAAELAERRQEGLAGMVRRGNALAEAISGGSGASGVLQLLRSDHELPLAVVDRTGRVLAAAGTSLTAEAAARVADGLRRHPPPLEIELGEQGSAAVFLIMVLNKVDAALLCLRPLELLRPTEREGLTQAAHYLSLEVARTQLAEAVEARFAGELLEMILSGSQVAAEVPSRLQAFGIDPQSPMIVAVAAFAGGETPVSAELAAAMGDFFPTEGVAAVVANGSRDVVAIFPWRRSADSALHLVRRMLDQVRRRLQGTRVVVGVSGPALGSRQLRRPLREAREACRVLRRRPGTSPVAWFSQLGTYQLLLSTADRETLRRLSEGVLAPVRDYDARQGVQVEATVRSFIDHDAHLASTAADLYIHVNTLRNRLAKFAELTGHDVRTTEGRVEVFLAFEAEATVRVAG
ncbi:PucR family transcriptional regulator [Salinactinospora qingdaonensis]|uniref:Helix-turn-helix domain-containing protein n=1 Tax=Salinactinospora qingdaonensis TaxID=702744 RepID=A0ABP7FU25_9ACTN